ncbi:MAG TPA: non-lysosomal glucosylceramidase, partial [Anaerolineaceae bacterium]|nr:non-lysosomal glucosylceramidase [Anaerolineaceae bacterium]
MRRFFALLLICSFIFSSCSSGQPPAATQLATDMPLNPTITALPPEATPTPEQEPLYDIPTVAWQRGIGEPYDAPGRAKTNYGIIDDGVWNGLPLGGLGAGAIGRSYRGDFSRWHLDLGSHVYESLPANQFSVYVSQGGQSQAHVLAPLQPSGSLASWNWDMPAGAGTYYALFPKAWFVYNWDTLPVRLEQMQFSPVIPNNYKEASYPVAVFEWKLNNPTDQPMTVSLMFSWQNLVGHQWGRDSLGGNYNMAVEQDGLTGVVLTHKGDQVSEEWDGSFAMLTNQADGVTVTYRSRVPMIEASTLWQDFSADGKLDNLDDEKVSSGEVLLAGLSASVELQPGETRTIPFMLAWDFPITEFGNGVQWFKRYTAFYGTTGRNAWQIAADAITAYPSWEAQIDAWQAPILAETGSPDWYKTALFNELYYLVDGGTVWENGRVDGKPEPALAPGVTQGHFAFLECYDYLYYNTFDVNFYSSFSMIHLWPELETGMLRDFAAAVQLEDVRTVIIASTNEPAQRKIAGAVPHDLGSPNEDPWRSVNAYNWTDINIWRDLNSKFVLQIWRDYVYTGDTALVQDLWPAAVEALDYLHAFDLDGSGLPDHIGLPDQTYDTWSLTGDSAYGGGLWLAALEAAIEMGNMVGDEANVARYTEWLAKGKVSYEKLWTGSYYLLDLSGSPTSDTIMADQLAGQWYADATGLAPIVPEEHIFTALNTVYENNVRKFQDGQMGAVNGMRPDGTIDESGEQSQEVWGGTTYALAAFMLGRGMGGEAWATAW